jgi:hypothetical protein
LANKAASEPHQSKELVSFFVASLGQEGVCLGRSDADASSVRLMRAKRGLIGVQEYLNAWGKELGVVLSALTVPLLLGILSVKDVD